MEAGVDRIERRARANEAEGGRLLAVAAVGVARARSVRARCPQSEKRQLRRPGRERAEARRMVREAEQLAGDG